MQLFANENTPLTIGDVIGFKFYSDEKVWLETTNHYLHHGNGYGNEVDALIIGDTPRAARVENLKKNDVFTVKGSTAWRTSGYTVYIPVAPLDIQSNVLIREDDESRTFGTVFKFPLKFKLRWQPEWVNGLDLWIANRWERTDFGKKVDDMRDILTLDGMEVGNIWKMMTLYNLERKTVPTVVLLDDNHTPLTVKNAALAIENKAAYRESQGSTSDRIIMVPHKIFKERHTDWFTRIVEGRYDSR